jgi:hypothetical protein
VSEPAFWRVTLTWPRPPDFGKPRANGYLPYQFDHPHAFVRPFAGQLPPGALETAEMRTRTIRVVAMLPAEDPRPRHPGDYTYTPSALLAIERVARAAQFGFCCAASTALDTPLPEPVRVTAEPVPAGQTPPATAGPAGEDHQ